MPYEPIHHKYRPQIFKDLVGQETIALTLSNALKQERIAPAYLFTGPRGTGKTSSARILAKSLNCLASDRPTPEPCGKCEACLAIAKGSSLDVMEIDAASNTGVDNIREIIERSRFAPVQCRYKIYAIDECHMLSVAAFNALLKTLEEPPPQVVFILATTDPQRVLSTIISRCQRFDYRRIPLPEMVGHLQYIAKEEKIAIADDALTLIAQIANGGLRDAESLLDQLSLLPDIISVEKVWDLVGAVPEQDLLKLLHAINQNNSLGVLEQCRSLLDRGREPIVVLQNLASFYLNLLIAKTAPQRPDMVAVTETCWQQLCQEGVNWNTNSILRGQQHLKEAENQLKRTTQPRLWLEVTLLGLLPQASQIVVHQPEIAISSTTVAPKVQPTVTLDSEKNIPQQHTQVVSEVVEEVIQISAKLQEVPPPPIQESQLPPQSITVEPVRESAIEATKSVNSPPSTSSNVDISNVDVEEIWRKVISCLHPPTTQALLKQQCHLVSFDGASAIVGISSATLQKLNQGKVPNIEKAFAQVVNHSVKVQLEVVAKDNQAKKNSEPVRSVPTQTVKPPEHNFHNPDPATQNDPRQEIQESHVEPAKPQSIPEKKPIESNISKSDFAVAVPNNVPPIREQSLSPNKAIAPPQVPATRSPEIVEEPLDSDYATTDLQKAIANLTQSFEGELVEMGDNSTETIDTDTSEIDRVEESTTNTDNGRPNIEDYDDDW